MKKWTLFVLFSLLFCLQIHGQNYRWDSKNFVYSNFKYRFTWEFPDMDLFKWKLTAGNAEHTVFKVEEVNSGTIAFVNITDVGHIEDKDIWPAKDALKKMMEISTKKSSELTGEICEITEFKNCIFCGKHAIKYVYNSYFKDERYKNPIIHVSVNYLYAYRNKLYIVGAKIHKEVYDLFDDHIYIFFKYGLLPEKKDLKF